MTYRITVVVIDVTLAQSTTGGDFTGTPLSYDQSVFVSRIASQIANSHLKDASTVAGSMVELEVVPPSWAATRATRVRPTIDLINILANWSVSLSMEENSDCKRSLVGTKQNVFVFCFFFLFKVNWSFARFLKRNWGDWGNIFLDGGLGEKMEIGKRRRKVVGGTIYDLNLDLDCTYRLG